MHPVKNSIHLLLSGLLRCAAEAGNRFPSAFRRFSRAAVAYCLSSSVQARRSLLLLLFLLVMIPLSTSACRHTLHCVSEPIIITIHFLSPQSRHGLPHRASPNNRILPHRVKLPARPGQATHGTRQTPFDLLIWNATSARLCLPQSPRIALRFHFDENLFIHWMAFVFPLVSVTFDLKEYCFFFLSLSRKCCFFLPIKTHRYNQFSSVDRWRTHSLTHRI